MSNHHPNEPGFTLIEMQISIFLGSIVVLIMGLLLYYEFDRLVRTQKYGHLRAHVQQLDTSFNYGLNQANTLNIRDGLQLSMTTERDVWQLNPSGLYRNNKILFAFNSKFQLQLISRRGDAIQLHIRLTNDRDRQEDMTLDYWFHGHMASGGQTHAQDQ